MRKAYFFFIMASLLMQQVVQAGENLLARSAAKLQDTNALTVAYLGGSLTAGSGAKRANETSWRAQTRDWFIRTFPDAKITEVNAAIGGTGSAFGVYRVGNDVLAHNPDLVFVEFSVNDAFPPEKGEPRSLRPAMEGIVRQIWMSNPMADIVFVYTTKVTYEPDHIKRQLSPAAKLNQDVADYYHIPAVNVGQALWDYMQANNRTWEDIMPDRVHPYDEGYEAYSKCMIDFLEAQDWSNASREPYTLPETQLTGGRAPVETQMLPINGFEHEGWIQEDEAVKNFPVSLYSDQSGAEIRIKFTGNAIGLYVLAKEDSASFYWSLDGSEFKERTTAYKSAGTRGRAGLVMILNPLWRKEVLPMESHEFVIRLPEAEAMGSGLRVAAVAINGSVE